MTDKDAGTPVPGPNVLTDAERAYFDSEGETPLLEDDDLGDGAQDDDGAPPPDGDQPERARGEDGKFVKTVPHQTFHREREERKRAEEKLGAIESEVQQLREFRARLEERARWAEEQARAQANPPVEPPDPDKDIFAALKYEREQRAALEAKITGREQQEQEARQTREFEAKIDTFWKQDVQQYATANPDFRPAATWLAEARDKQLQGTAVADPRMRDPQWRNYVIDSELKQIIVAAAQQKRSPAEMVYEIAQSWGYSPHQAAQPGQPPAMPDRLQRVQTAQGASRTVGDAAGRAGASSDYTIDSFAAMSQPEFNAVMATPEGQAAWKRLMGG